MNLEVIAIVFTEQNLKLKIIRPHILSTYNNEMRNVCPCVATKVISKQCLNVSVIGACYFKILTCCDNGFVEAEVKSGLEQLKSDQHNSL